MPLFLDTLYANRISSRLDHFKKKSQNLYNMRCPFCGDSSKNQYKARGYLFKEKDTLIYHCHNCGVSISFSNFLNKIDSSIYKEYMFDLMQYKNPTTVLDKPKPKIVKSIDINLPTIESLPNNHLAKQYCVARMLPKIFFKELYFSEDFKGFVDEIKPDEDRKLLNNELRLVIPFIDELNNLVGFQGRALTQSTNNLRYISIRLDETSEKMVYGLNRLNQTKKIYVLEGPFDSMFLDNSIAVTTSKLNTILGITGLNKNYTFIYDNQPKNSQVTGFMEGTINTNYSIFIWPPELKEYKDINDAIKGGYTNSEIQSIIDSRTYNGLMAKLEKQQWMK